MLGMSQEGLAECLSLTFQQIQKYEKGTNRISASKLFESAQAMGCQISYFFEGMPEEPVEGVVSQKEVAVSDFLHSTEGVQLAATFPRIRSARLRRRVLELVTTMADMDEVE